MIDVDAISSRVVELRKDNRFDEAERILRDAIQEEDKAWKLWNQLGHVLNANGNFKEAAASFERATRLNPNGFWLWLSLGYTRKELEQIDEAIDVTLKATKLATKTSEIGSALYNLGCYNCIAGRTDEALVYLGRAFERDESIRNWAKDDSDLESLRTDKRFRELLKSNE
ncbi:MAG: tetratricopeptide repeat protein [Promethearchaeota archaeon]